MARLRVTTFIRRTNLTCSFQVTGNISYRKTYENSYQGLSLIGVEI